MGVRPESLLPGCIAPIFALGAGAKATILGRAEPGRTQMLLFERGHWCGACRRHLSLVSEQHERLDSRQIDVLVVSHEAASELVGRVYPFPVHVDPNLEIGVHFDLVHNDEVGFRTLRPTTLLIDEQGVIRFSYVGDDSHDRPTIAAVLLAFDHLI